MDSEATIGGVLTVPPIHAALVEHLGRGFPMSTTYRLLARHGWRKVQPAKSIQRAILHCRKISKKLPEVVTTACLINEDQLLLIPSSASESDHRPQPPVQRT
jgi:hypothetical protein